MTAGEDTTAQLREQIAAAINVPAVKADHEWSLGMADRVLPIVLAQVEAAKATARRDALTAVLAVPYCRDVGHTEAIHSAAGCCDPYEDPCAAMAACQYPADRCGECVGEPLSCEAGDGTDCPFEPSAGGASAQGVAPLPAEVCGSKHPEYEVRCAQDPGHAGPHTMYRGTSANLLWPQRSGGQGAQSSGHEYVAPAQTVWHRRAAELGTEVKIVKGAAQARAFSWAQPGSQGPTKEET